MQMTNVEVEFGNWKLEVGHPPSPRLRRTGWKLVKGPMLGISLKCSMSLLCSEGNN
jgi:hypothetical protein